MPWHKPQTLGFGQKTTIPKVIKETSFPTNFILADSCEIAYDLPLNETPCIGDPVLVDFPNDTPEAVAFVWRVPRGSGVAVKREGQQPAVRKADASVVVRVSIERPFVDPVLIDRLLCDANAHPGTDYIGYVLGDGRSAHRARASL